MGGINKITLNLNTATHFNFDAPISNICFSLPRNNLYEWNLSKAKLNF